MDTISQSTVGAEFSRYSMQSIGSLLPTTSRSGHT